MRTPFASNTRHYANLANLAFRYALVSPVATVASGEGQPGGGLYENNMQKPPRERVRTTLPVTDICAHPTHWTMSRGCSQEGIMSKTTAHDLSRLRGCYVAVPNHHPSTNAHISYHVHRDFRLHRIYHIDYMCHSQTAHQELMLLVSDTLVH